MPWDSPPPPPEQSNSKHVVWIVKHKMKNRDVLVVNRSETSA